MIRFATFWSGPLPALARACLASFPARGAELTLYSYEPATALPAGIEPRDAREICPDLRAAYLVKGRPSLAAFSDRFRLEMMTKRELCWVDADMIALRPQALRGPVVWGRQPEAKGKALINNAVLQLPPGHPVLEAMLKAAREAEGKDLSWGAIGPYLLTEIAETHGVYATSAPPERFFAVAPDEFWRLFDPASRDGVSADVRGSDLVHLWSELLRRMDYDFDAAPPPGSYLHETLALDGFKRVASAGEIAAMIERWKASAPKEP